VDLQKVRQRAGHGSLEVTSRYAAILDERDTSLADALEEVLDDPDFPAGVARILFGARTAESESSYASHATWPQIERALFDADR